MSKKGGHHGGAWKVAYADFVTAMMALFLVLWLTAQDAKIKEAVARAFRNPFASVTKESVGVIPNPDSQALKSSQGNFDSASVVELTMLRKLNMDLAKLTADNEIEPALKLEITPEGMRINVFDRSRKPIFEKDTTAFTEYGNFIFSTLAWIIAKHTNQFRIELEGHTEQGHSIVRKDYDNWELSADRANIARRKLINHGISADQIYKVAGYADTQPMRNVVPKDESNRRVTVLLKPHSNKPT